MGLKTNREEFDKTLREDGQFRDYLVLSDEERAKGFVRPVRISYLHVGAAGPTYPLIDLTPEQKIVYKQFNFVKFEKYSQDLNAGRMWTQKALDSVDNGCGAKTILPQAIAETYARNPVFYSSTFCATCGKHFPVGPDGEFVWEDGTRVGS